MSDVALVKELRGSGLPMPTILDTSEILSMVLPILGPDFRLTERGQPTLTSLSPRLSLLVGVIGGWTITRTLRRSPSLAGPDSGPLCVSLWEGGLFFIENH